MISARLFRADIEGYFVARPNRFTVYVDTPRGMLIAHCANPGRMEEILTPGRRLILESARGQKRRTPYTLVAARYKNKIIPLHAQRANLAARELAIPLFFPDAKTILSEPRSENGRFDFKITTADGETYVEIKSCSLVEERIAMFPDAPTSRGKRHVDDLGKLVHTHNGVSASVIFMITHPDALAFIPNIHTDPDLGLALVRNSEHVSIRACSIRCDDGGMASMVNAAVPVLLNPVQCVADNTGIYLICVELENDVSCSIGALGEMQFERGWYVYVGSAKGTMKSRIARHLRKRKTLKWHIDYLLEKASSVSSFPIYTAEDLECKLAQSLKGIAGNGVPNFGSSDCSCQSHLFQFPTNPMGHEKFRGILYQFRHREAFASELSRMNL